MKILSSVLIILILMFSACSSKTRLGPDGQPLSEADLAGGYDARFGEGRIPLAEGEGAFRDIHFAYDSSTIDEYALQDIEYNMQVMQEYPNLTFQLEGHCDERGTAEYNMALGSKRAKSVQDVLVSMGVSASRLSTVSYGEELPLDTSSSEQSWAKNRRVHFAGFK